MSRRTAINAGLSIAGVALLIWQINLVGGLDTVGAGLSRVGLGFLLILALAYVRFALRSYAWITLIPGNAPLGRATAATISGDALGNLTPLGLAASEPAKAVYLSRNVDATQAFAALTAENFFYSVSVAIYIVLGVVAMLMAFELPDAVRVSGIAALVLMCGVLVAAGWIAWQRPTVLSAVLERFSKAGSQLNALVGRIRDFEVRTYGSTGHAGARLGVLAITEVLFHIVSFFEAWLTLYLLTGASRPLEALILDSVNRVINVVGKMIPMRVGVDEVSAEIVASAIGLAPGVGTTAGLVRKVRMIVWAAVGLVVWWTRGRSAR